MEIANFQTNFDKWRITPEDILQDDLIRYHSAFSMPTLQYLSSVKLIASLWCKHLRNFNHQLTWSQVCKVANKINAEMKQMLPKRLREDFSHIVIVIGQELSNWIEFYEYYVFKKRRKRKYVAIEYLDKLVWSSRGTIDHLETAKAMLTIRKSILYKNCSILCSDCRNSNDKLIGFPVFLYGIEYADSNDTQNPDQYFWINFMHRSIDEWDRIKESNCLYCFAREASNFLKNTPASEYDLRAIFNLHYEFHITYSCYIVSKLDQNQQEEFFDFNVFFDDVLPQFLMEPLHLDYFLPTFYHMREDIIEDNAGHILIELNNLIIDHCCDTSKGYEYLYDKYVFFFEQSWSFLPSYIKDYVLEADSQAFDWLWQYNSLNLLGKYFATCRPTFKRLLLFSNRALNFCEEMLKNDEWQLFTRYVCPVFFEESEEVELLKKEFVDEMNDVFCHYIQAKKWNQLDVLFNWAYTTETQRMEEKKILLREGFCYGMCENRCFAEKHYQTRYQRSTKRVINLTTNFTHFDELLRWCFDSKKEIDQFKRTDLCHSENFTIMVCEMIKLGRLDIIKQLLSWCFSNNYKLIQQFKKTFGNGLDELEKSIAKDTPTPKRRRFR